MAPGLRESVTWIIHNADRLDGDVSVQRDEALPDSRVMAIADAQADTAKVLGYGQNDLFTFQARAFLEQVAGTGSLPPVPSFEHGLHNLRLLAAVTESAAEGGAEIKVS